MSAGIGVIGLLVLVVLFALGLGGVLLIVFGLVGRKKPGGEGGACGACGYSVKGLESLNCPECGADLREVGIHRPGGGNGGRNAMLVSGIVLLALLGMCVLGSMFLTFGVQRQVTVQAVPHAPLQTVPAPTPSPAP